MGAMQIRHPAPVVGPDPVSPQSVLDSMVMLCVVSQLIACFAALHRSRLVYSCGGPCGTNGVEWDWIGMLGEAFSRQLDHTYTGLVTLLKRDKE